MKNKVIKVRWQIQSKRPSPPDGALGWYNEIDSLYADKEVAKEELKDALENYPYQRFRLVRVTTIIEEDED